MSETSRTPGAAEERVGRSSFNWDPEGTGSVPGFWSGPEGASTKLHFLYLSART